MHDFTHTQASHSKAPSGTGGQVVRHIFENLVLSEIELDAAFIELMTKMKDLDYAVYTQAARMARKQPAIIAGWKLIMLDIMLAAAAGRLIEDDQTFREMCALFCPSRSIPFSENIAYACLNFHGNTLPVNRHQIILSFITH